ncbi:MAG: L,D-transpeptidase [Gemmatimonadetes bacterium]|nr:L,D-transpeptidase [Gemmatimonadota bacterium]
MRDAPTRRNLFASGGPVAWLSLAAVVAAVGLAVVRLRDALAARRERDLTQAVYNDNADILAMVRAQAASAGDSLERVLAASPDSLGDQPYIVISIAENQLWYKRGSTVLFRTRVATGTGKHLERAGGSRWTFETPRGRLVVLRKDVDPAWVPPDWHYVEAARKAGKRLRRLEPSKPIPLAGGAVIAVSGNDVVTRYPDGREIPFEVAEGKEIVVGRDLIVPPMNTNQRRYAGVLGVNRLYLGDGYGIHGTDAPASIGRGASHGCVRVRNEDIETLFRIVPVGTPVYIY